MSAESDRVDRALDLARDLSGDLMQARSTRDAAQAEATRQTLRAREATAARDALLEDFGRLLAVADNAWAYLQTSLGPCDESCDCILHDFEALKLSGVPLKTTAAPRIKPCICPVVGGPYGAVRHQWNPACRRHTGGRRCSKLRPGLSR